MALKSTIDANAPDKIEYAYDRTAKRRGYWAPDDDNPNRFNFVPQGYLVSTDRHTIKTWFACSLAACEAFIDAYAGGGSIEAPETSPVLKSHNLVLTETQYFEEWLDDDEVNE